LLLERTRTTRVWVDDKDCGADDTLSAPQWQPSKHSVEEDPAAQNGIKRDAKW